MTDPSNAEPSRDPDFICGALRSGTTMLRLMVDHHPRLSNFGETDFLFEYPLGENGRGDPQGFRALLARDGMFANSGLSMPQGESVHEMIRDLCDQMRAPGRALTINIHRNFERIAATFPEARIVHIVRDPRDVARSSVGMGFSGNSYFGVDHWIASEKSMQALRAANPDMAFLTIKNEDLVRSPEPTLTRVCAFLGVNYDPQMLTYPDHSTYDAPDPSLVEQWRRKMAPGEIGLIEGKVGEMLTERGYQPSGHPVVIPDGAALRKLESDHRWGRFRTSLKRFGPVLVGAELIGRRAGIAPLRDFAARRINEKQKKFLK